MTPTCAAGWARRGAALIRTLAALACWAACAVRGQDVTTSAPGAPRLVVFRYDPNTTFAIVAMPGVPTDLQLAPEEHITGFAMGDSVQWLVEELPGHVFVKPLQSGLFTAGTLVTDRRTYQLSFQSRAEPQQWFQRVSWVYPDLVLFRGAERSATESSRGAAGPRPPVAPADARTEADTATPDPAQMNFDYEIAGSDAVRPVAVFDDGQFTWMRMRPLQSLPALFVVGPDGVQLANYLVRGDYLVLQRLISRALLKLGSDEAQITRRPPASGAAAPGPRRREGHG